MNTKNTKIKVFTSVASLLAVLLLCLVSVFSYTNVAQAAVNEQINYQGRLLNNAGAVVADGNYNIKFRIYQDGTGCVSGGSSPCGGTLKWTETRQNSATQGVAVANGYFSVNLGSVTAFASSVDWNQGTLWLSVDVGGTGTGGSPTYDGEMLPFRRLASVPQALNSNLFNGLQSTSFVQLAQGVQTDSSTANASIFINKTGGTADILTLQRGGANVFNISNGGTTTFRTDTDATTGFQINDSDGGVPIVNVDTDNERVGIGDASPASLFTVGASDAFQINNSGQVTSGTWNGTDIAVADGGTGSSTSQGAINNISQLTTNGDLLYHNGTNSNKLARGANGECLTSNATTLVWGACGSGSVSLQTAYDNGNTITTAKPTIVLDATTTTGTVVGDKDSRILLRNDSGTVGAGGEIVLGATADTTTKRYAVIGSEIQSNPGTGATGDVYIATKTDASDTTLTKYFGVRTDGQVNIGDFTPDAKLEVRSSAAEQLFRVVDGSSEVALIADGGAATFRTATDSATGFKIQDVDLGTSIFNVDTINERVGIKTDSPTTAFQVNGQQVIGAGDPFLEASIPGTTQLTLNKDSGYAVQAFQVASTTPADTGGINGARSRGTVASPTQSQSGDVLFQIGATGYTTSNSPANLSNTQSSLSFVQDAASTATTAPAALVYKPNASGSDAFRIASNGNVIIGTSDTTGTLLILDDKTSLADPGGQDGAMYYNSVSDSFRCDQNSTDWTDCIGIPKPNTRRNSYLVHPGSGTVFSLVGDIGTAGAAGTSIAATTSEPSAINYASGAVSGNTNHVSGNTNYDTDNKIIYQSYVVTQTTTLVRYWLGITNQTAATMSASANPAGNYAAFRFDTSAGDTNWMCITKDGTTQATPVSSGVAAANTAGKKFEVVQTSASVIFKIDGAVVCTLSGNLPSANTLLRYANTVTTLTAAAASIRVSWIYIESNK